MTTGSLIQTIAGFAAIVLVGAAMRGVGLVRREDGRAIKSLIIYLGLPALVFDSVHGARFSMGVLIAVGISWLVFLGGLALALVAGKLLGLRRRTAGGLALCAALGNTGYIGYPLASALLGPASVPIAVLYDVFGTVMQFVLVGFPVARRFGEGPRLTALGIARELVTFPAFMAALAALALTPFSVPEAIRDWLDLFARMVAPLIMLSVGMSLQPRGLMSHAKGIVAVGTVRLIVAPLLAVLFASWWLPGTREAAVVTLEAGMPSMMLALVLGGRYGLDEEFIAAAIFVTTVASALTLPLMQALIR